ncbi:hypothetical protein EMIHUDRAFT_465973, partial [Emiliania huxleyi CCMP1516]
SRKACSRHLCILLDFILLGVGALNLVQDPVFGLTEIGPNGTLSEILVDEDNKTDYAIAQLSTAVVGLVAALCCACLSQPADVRRRFAAGLLWCLYAAPGLSWLGIVGWQSATLAQDWRQARLANLKLLLRGGGVRRWVRPSPSAIRPLQGRGRRLRRRRPPPPHRLERHELSEQCIRSRPRAELRQTSIQVFRLGPRSLKQTTGKELALAYCSPSRAFVRAVSRPTRDRPERGACAAGCGGVLALRGGDGPRPTHYECHISVYYPHRNFRCCA